MEPQDTANDATEAAPQPAFAPSTSPAQPAADIETSSAAADPVDGPDPVDVQVPEFSELREQAALSNGGGMNRFYDVNVTVWAELGRAAMPLGELVKLGEGTVLKLGRSVSEPVDLVAQGVRLARGEVVVVDDCFAVRIKEIEPRKEERSG